MITQKQIIINYLQERNDWTPSHFLQGVPTRWGFIGSEGKRRARELVVEGKLEHKIEGKFVYYRVKPLQYKQYKVLGVDGQVEKLINVSF